jgi:hypothetical protein
LTDSLIDRIKDKGQQARSLLSPWLRSTGIQESDRAGSFPVSERHRLAARSMRVLDDRKLGSAHPENLLSLSADFSEKMRSFQEMVQFNPKITRETSIWPQVDQVYPSASAEAPREPEQPGVMRTGSVIQKFSMTPRPGQSIEAFKEQAARTNQAKPAAARPSKPALPAQSRLFSRVQEINPKDTGTEIFTEEPQAELPLPAPPPSPVPEPPHDASDREEPSGPSIFDTVESPTVRETPPPVEEPKQPETLPEFEQAAPKPEPPAPDMPGEASSDKPLHVPAPRPKQEHEPLPPPDSSTQSAASPDSGPEVKPSPLARTVDKSSTEHAPLKQARPAGAAGKTSQPAAQARIVRKPAEGSPDRPAKPAAKTVSTVQRQPDRPKPAGSSPSGPPWRAPSTPLRSAQQVPRLPEQPVSASQTPPVPRPPDQPASSPLTPVVQREPDPSDSPPETSPAEKVLPARPVTPAVGAAPPQAMSGDDIMPVASRLPRAAPIPAVPGPERTPLLPPGIPPVTVAPASTLPELSQPSFPLQNHLVERKRAARALKTGTPETLRAIKAAPLVQPRLSLVSEHKYRYQSLAAPPAPVAPVRSAASSDPVAFAAGSVLPPEASTESFEPAETTFQALNMTLPALSLAPARASTARPALTAAPVAAPIMPEKQPDRKLAEAKADRSTQERLEAQAEKPERKAHEATIQSAKGGVVQRRWEEHSGVEASSRIQSASQPSLEVEPVDLDQLASDVLPLVKRLLEIEIERSSGSFH